ncbi:DsbA family protein [Phenylobacterium aquaticum]|uniref:DsbA family protein n=1 Tax=Phenylobacterium aquaticum TaxID=1763816 RepID=UPI0026F1DBB0|nr:DsbA family protein [Phenylobacterium aquaticum]
MKTPFRVAAVALCALLALTGCQKSADAAFGEKVRGYLLAHPEVIEEAIVALNAKKQADAANLAKASLTTQKKALEADPRDFVANPGGQITVVEFFDYRCGYCKLSAPEVVKIIQQNPDVRFVFKEFPIFGAESDLAAKIALTSAGKAKGVQLYQAWMAEKALDDAAIDRHLAALGIDPTAAKAAGESPAIAKQLADTRDLAKALNIEGTPAFIVGDRMIPGADLPALRAAITEAKAAIRRAG